MIIVRMFGGLRNQMFQYALYYSMRCKGLDAYVDLSWYDRWFCHNGYELNRVFSIFPRISSELDVNRLSENDKSILWRAWHKFVRRKDTFYCRYGKDAIKSEVFDLNEKYFMEYAGDIRNIYSFSEFDNKENIQLASMIRGTESVSLHVRRGDYLNEPLFNDICNERYYEVAMREIKKRVHNPVLLSILR